MSRIDLALTGTLVTFQLKELHPNANTLQDNLLILPRCGPQTGQEIKIAPRKVLTFKPSQVLKNAINS